MAQIANAIERSGLSAVLGSAASTLSEQTRSIHGQALQASTERGLQLQAAFDTNSAISALASATQASLELACIAIAASNGLLEDTQAPGGQEQADRAVAVLDNIEHSLPERIYPLVAPTSIHSPSRHHSRSASVAGGQFVHPDVQGRAAIRQVSGSEPAVECMAVRSSTNRPDQGQRPVLQTTRPLGHLWSPLDRAVRKSSGVPASANSPEISHLGGIVSRYRHQVTTANTGGVRGPIQEVSDGWTRSTSRPNRRSLESYPVDAPGFVGHSTNQLDRTLTAPFVDGVNSQTRTGEET